MKQRLIDANKLEPSEIYIGFDFARIVYMDDIDEMPTVEAIPIEWIYLWRLKNMDKCPVDYIPFSELLNDWEKENGID